MHVHAQHLAIHCMLRIACCELHAVLFTNPRNIHTLYNGRVYDSTLVLPKAMPIKPGRLHKHSGHDMGLI